MYTVKGNNGREYYERKVSKLCGLEGKNDER